MRNVNFNFGFVGQSCLVLLVLTVVGCGDSETVKSMFGERDEVCLIIRSEGLLSETNPYTTDSLYTTDRYVDWPIELIVQHMSLRRSSGNSNAAPYMVLKSADSRSEGGFEVGFIGDYDRYLTYNDKGWSSWHGGVLIPGSGSYIIEDDVLELRYSKNELEELGLIQDVASNFPIVCQFSLINSGMLTLDTVDFGLSAKELGEWQKRYKYLVKDIPENEKYIVQIYTMDSIDEFCNQDYRPRELMGKSKLTAGRVDACLTFLKMEAKMSGKPISWSKLEDLTFQLDKYSSCEAIRMANRLVSYDLNSALVKVVPNYNKMNIHEEILSDLVYLNGVSPGGKEAWRSLGDFEYEHQLKTTPDMVTKAIFMYGWQKMNVWQNNSWLYSSYRDEARENCRFALDLAEKWGLDTEWYQTNLEKLDEITG